jgi:hypothetical protein
MRICPKCQKTYNDDNLNFCLDDGSVLNQATSSISEDKLPETVMMSPPRQTSPNQPFNNPPSNQSASNPPPSWGHQQQQQPAWGGSPGSQIPQNQPKSKSWMWVLGILGAIVVLCGGGLVGIVALLANMEPSDLGNNNGVIENNEKKTPTITTTDFNKIDLSKWEATNPAYAESEYKDGEFIMGTKQKGYYYVLVSSAYKTVDAVSRVTVRNVEDKPSRLGYGLIFHSNPKPLNQDYGFLIDTDKQRYRVVTHSPGKETDVIKWTRSTAIKQGTAKNVLEVRDKDNEITLYINGVKIDSIKNTDGYKDGVPGIYAGDGIPIAFSDLEVGK